MKKDKKAVLCRVEAQYVRADMFHPSEGSNCLIICKMGYYIVEAVSRYSNGEYDWINTLDGQEGKVLLWTYAPFPSDKDLEKALLTLGEHPLKTQGK